MASPTGSPAGITASNTSAAAPKKKNRNKKRKDRRKSFAPPPELPTTGDMDRERLALPSASSRAANRSTLYRLSQGIGSHTSLESTSLLDHR